MYIQNYIVYLCMEKIIYKSPLNYTGAKDKLMPTLLEHFPSDVDTFYDVFAGGLSVTINCDYDKIVSNDIISPMVEFYKEIKSYNNFDDLVETVIENRIDKNKEKFNEIRSEFNKTKDPFLFFSLVSSCTNNMMRFNKKFEFNQTFGNRTINDSTISKLKEYHRIIHEKQITFTNFSYRELLLKFNPTSRDFVYLDPPYMITEAGYNSYWSMDDEHMLYYFLDMLDNNGVRFLMSNVRNHKGVENPFMDKVNKWNVIDIDYNYEKVAKKKGLGSQEIIIKNF